MASIEKRIRDGRQSWQARWRDPSGRQRKRTFTRKSDAERFLTTVEAAKLTGSYVDHSDKTTVEQYARAWAASRPHRLTTAVRTASLIDNHIAGSSLGRRRLASVLPSEVQAWATAKSQELAPTSVRRLVALLRSIYAAAVMDRLVASSPAVRIALPRYEGARVVPLAVEQVRRLADAFPTRCQAMVLTQAGLGLRIGELFALRVSDVDFLRRTVRIETQVPPDGRRERTNVLKTPRSRRTIPLPSMVANALAEHIAAYPPTADGSLFTTTGGRLYSHSYFGSQLFQRAVARSGLPQGTTSHDLRHHFASLLLAAGESVVAVAELLGHDDAQLVLSTYGHLMPGREDLARRAIDDAWCAPGVPLDVAE